MMVVVLSDPFREMRTCRDSTETQQLGHAPRFGPEVKNGRSSAKDGAGEAQMWDNPEGSEICYLSAFLWDADPEGNGGRGHICYFSAWPSTEVLCFHLFVQRLLSLT